MSAVRVFDFWESLGAMRNVLLSLSPLFVFSVILAAAICATFLLLLPWLGRKFPGGNAAPAGPPPQAPASVSGASTLSYVLMTSLLGLIVGMLVNQIGGLEALTKPGSEGTFIEGIASTLLVVVGAVGTLLVDQSEVEIRRPMGLTAFLSSFLVSCLYWTTLNA